MTEATETTTATRLRRRRNVECFWIDGWLMECGTRKATFCSNENAYRYMCRRFTVQVRTILYICYMDVYMWYFLRTIERETIRLFGRDGVQHDVQTRRALRSEWQVAPWLPTLCPRRPGWERTKRKRVAQRRPHTMWHERGGHNIWVRRDSGVKYIWCGGDVVRRCVWVM